MQSPEPPHQSVESKEPKKDHEKNDIEKLAIEVAQKFWFNTKEFVEAINSFEKKPPNSWIQFQTYRTHYYGVMASTFSFTNVKSKTEWVCVKVGFTQLDRQIWNDLCRFGTKWSNTYAGRETEDVNLESIKQQGSGHLQRSSKSFGSTVTSRCRECCSPSCWKATWERRGEKTRTSSSHGMGHHERWAVEKHYRNLPSSRGRFVTSDDAWRI